MKINQFEKSYLEWVKSHEEFVLEKDEELEDYLEDIDEGFSAGWSACKQEILKILTDNSNRISRYTNEDFYYMAGIDPSVIEKIKNL